MFSIEGKFFKALTKAGDFLILGFLGFVFSIPVITMGASITAMFYVGMKLVRDEEGYVFKGFIKSFKQNFKQATIINLIMLLIGLVLYVDLNVSKAMQGGAGQIFHVIFMAFVLIYFILFLYVYPVLARFYNTIKNTIKNALFMAIRHLPYTVVMVLIAECPLLLLLVKSYQIQSTLFVLFLLMGFALIAYCNSYFLAKIFDNYMPKEEAGQESAGESV